MAAEALGSVGITLEIKDVESQGEMYKAVISGEADMWCGAWLGENDPGIRQNFHSGGADNYFGLRDDEIDEIILQAEAADSRELYKTALEAVLARGVCVPVYQRKIYYIYSGALNQRTIEGNLTTHYNFADVIHKITLV
jgi:peptide/nickel transport system substrate-binding protein